MAKRIITEEDILQAAAAGLTALPAQDGQCIVTDQARDRALELGVALDGDCRAASGVPSCTGPACPGTGTDGVSGVAAGAGSLNAAKSFAAGAAKRAGNDAAQDPPDDAETASLTRQVVDALRAKLPPQTDAAQVERLVRQALAARMPGPRAHPANPREGASGFEDGFRFVEAASVLGQGAVPGIAEKALLAEALASAGEARLSAGYMAWERSSFTRQVEAPEVGVVIEGELHLTIGGRTVIGRPGDMLYLPRGAKVVYSTPSRVTMACVNAKA